MSVAERKSLLNSVINEMPPEDISVVYKLFYSYIMDYQDRHLTPEEQAEHLLALEEDKWYE